ncbi:MAG: glycosidase, partial [Candidatus Roizmanbacteria bacterium]|nr:glycosidase [Candidatus Roizmanbacteria bacterium]
MLLNRHPQNPIISPNSNNSWESFATFNGAIIKRNDLFHMLYRSMGDETRVLNFQLRMSTIGKATSHDGISFENHELFIKPEESWERYGCEDPRVIQLEGTYYIFYTA